MAEAACQVTTGDSAHARAKNLLLKVLGARRVAAYCGVAELTVYQWLQRGSDAAPIPARHAPAIVAGAKADGIDCPIEVLMPGLGGGS